MITFPNGLSISSIMISTALGHFGRGFLPFFRFPNYWRLVSTIKQERISVATKSSTRFPRVGNFVMKDPRTWKYVQRLPDMGMLNAYGLTNDGVEECAREIAISRKKGFNVIPNFYPEFDKGEQAIQETLEAIEIFCFYFETEKWILELNFSCPNSEEVIAENIQMALRCVTGIKKKLCPGVTVVTKTSIAHPYQFYTMLEDAGADCIHAINTIPYAMLSDSVSPQRIGGGGVSGGPAFQKAFSYISKIPNWTSLPLIFGCGVVNRHNMDRYFSAGAQSVSICTLAARAPKKARELILEFGN